MNFKAKDENSPSKFRLNSRRNFADKFGANLRMLALDLASFKKLVYVVRFCFVLRNIEKYGFLEVKNPCYYI